MRHFIAPTFGMRGKTGWRLGNVRRLPHLHALALYRPPERVKPHPYTAHIRGITVARRRGGRGSIKTISSWSINISIRKDGVYAHIRMNTHDLCITCTPSDTYHLP